MTQDELNAILEGMGGAASVKYAPVLETKTIKNPAHKNNGGTSWTVPEELQVRISRWWNPKTGQVVEAYANPDGTYTVTRQGEDKGLVSAEARAKDPDDPAARNAAELQRQREKNAALPADQDPAYETDAERRQRAEARIKQQGEDARQAAADARAEAERNKPQTVPTNTTEPNIVTRMPDGTIKTEPNPNYRPPEGTTKQESVKGSDGKDYVRVTTVKPDGTVTIKIFGPDKREVSEIPGEGPSRPTVSGPPLPQIVLGASQDAARTYKEQLQEGVAAGRWSQAWADARWREFMEVANLAVSEAATRQRNEESQRNAEFNIANARMGSMNTATANALTFVNNINGYLPAGSNLGGQAFAALLGLNMLQSQMSGMNKIDPRRAPPTLTPAEISNPAALQARREQVQTQVQQAAAPPAPAPAAAPDPSIPPIQGSLVEEQAPAPAPAPSGGAFPPLPVVPRAGTEAGGNVQKAMPNPAGEWAALAPLAPMPMQQPAMAGAAQMGEPVAVRRARIAATPPWRLSEDDIAWSEQNGFGQEAWGVPGRVA